ncbi:MAG: hypothetical protein QF357_04350 [Dehalococcoidia bacterium]|nr:hypothetical protein [Dehalococcoidia bacterium]
MFLVERVGFRAWCFEANRSTTRLESVSLCVDSRLGAIRATSFREDIGDVANDGVLGDKQHLSDLAI